MDREIRELLALKAESVPPYREVPRALTTRVRRRIALNALAVGTTALVLAAGAFVGVRALSSSGIRTPITSPPSPPPSLQPTPSSSATAACTSAQVRAVASMEGAAGSRFGAIAATNFSDQACTIQGVPAVTLLDQNGNPITEGISFRPSQAGWQVNRSPEPPGWPVVTLAPGESASVRIRWSNWCPDGRAAPQWQMEVSGGGSVDVSGFDAAGPPPCNGPGLLSTVELGPFEPSSGP